MRRRAVNISARPHDAIATSTPPSGRGPCAMPSGIAWPSQPSATSSRMLAIDTKMSLNPEISRKCSSSTSGARCDRARKSRSRSTVGRSTTPAATAASRSSSLNMGASSCRTPDIQGVLVRQYAPSDRVATYPIETLSAVVMRSAVDRAEDSRTMPDRDASVIAAVSGIGVVPTILDTVCRTTGMGFAAVARVTEERWIACNVRDEIDFGLVAGWRAQARDDDLPRDTPDRRSRDHQRRPWRSAVPRPSHARALWIPQLYLDADPAARRAVLRHIVRDRSPSRRSGSARDRRHA